MNVCIPRLNVLATLRRIAPALALGIALLGGDAIVARAEPPPNGLSGIFGENQGSAQVVPATGAMTYAIPFQLPAARGTAQPGLSLRYASGAGTGRAWDGRWISPRSSGPHSRALPSISTSLPLTRPWRRTRIATRTRAGRSRSSASSTECPRVPAAKQ